MKPLRPDLLTYSPDFDIVTRKGTETALPAKTFIADLRAAAAALSKNPT